MINKAHELIEVHSLPARMRGCIAQWIRSTKGGVARLPLVLVCVCARSEEECSSMAADLATVMNQSLSPTKLDARTPLSPSNYPDKRSVVAAYKRMVCVRMCVRERARARERKRERGRVREVDGERKGELTLRRGEERVELEVGRVLEATRFKLRGGARRHL